MNQNSQLEFFMQSIRVAYMYVRGIGNMCPIIEAYKRFNAEANLSHMFSLYRVVYVELRFQKENHQKRDFWRIAKILQREW